MPAKAKKKTNAVKSTVTRSAITGHYVKTSTVKRHPEATVTQTVTRSPAKPKAKKKP